MLQYLIQRKVQKERQKDKVKKVAILQTGGLDSTYLIIKNMIHCEDVKSIKGTLSNCNECNVCHNYNIAYNSLNKKRGKQNVK